MKKILIPILALFLTSCSGTHSSVNQNQIAEKPFDSTLIKPYLNLLPNAGKEAKEFIPILTNTIQKFQGRPLDTTLLVVGLIDSDKINDTIVSHVFVEKDTVIINSSWRRQGEQLWQFRLKDPLYIVDTFELFSTRKRSVWVTFTIGFKYAIPRLHYPVDEYRNTVSVMAVIQALKNDSIFVEENAFQQYWENFHGSIIELSDPEFHPAYIWFEPKRMFVLLWVG
jgi:hypothetical protein